MRTENANKERLLSRQANADLGKNLVVKDIGGGKVDLVTASNQKPAGVVRYDADSGRAASVQYGPSDTLVLSGAAVGDNVEVMADATSRVIAAVGAGNYALGKTTNGSIATAAGQLITIELYPEAQRIL